MKKSAPNVNGAELEKSIDKLSGLIEKLKAVRQKIGELKKNIREEIVRDGLVWNVNLPRGSGAGTGPNSILEDEKLFEDNVEYHRQIRRGLGEAQYLYTKLQPLKDEAQKLNEKIRPLIEELAKSCEGLRGALKKNLQEALAENFAAVTRSIRPLCADEDEARALAEGFSCVAEINSRLPVTPVFDPEKPIASAGRLLREFRSPIRKLTKEVK
jgi:hypothetical protein